MRFDKAISLGSTCKVAYHLSMAKIRAGSYPFDWLVTPFRSLCRVLSCDFAEFAKRDNLRLSQCGSRRCVEDKLYEVQFLHDFVESEAGGGDHFGRYDEEFARYRRRIARFREAMTSGKRLCLFRYVAPEDDLAEGPELDALLQSLWPNLQYHLVMLTSGRNAGGPPDTGRVSSHRVPDIKESERWAEGHEVWKRLFESLTLGQAPRNETGDSV